MPTVLSLNKGSALNLFCASSYFIRSISSAFLICSAILSTSSELPSIGKSLLTFCNLVIASCNSLTLNAVPAKSNKSCNGDLPSFPFNPTNIATISFLSSCALKDACIISVCICFKYSISSGFIILGNPSTTPILFNN